MGHKKIAAVVPAFNVARSIPTVLSHFRNVFPDAHIIVVDDGSSDNLQNALEQFQLHLIRHDSNRGKGAALQSGFRKAIELQADYVFTIDGDGQHAAGESLKLLRKMTEDKLDIVIGARIDRREMPFHRAMSNKVTSWLVSLRLGQKILDSQSGFRLIRSEALKQIELISRNFQLETELIIKAHIAGFRIGVTEISTIYGNQQSSMKVRDVFRFVKLYVSSFLWL